MRDIEQKYKEYREFVIANIEHIEIGPRMKKKKRQLDMIKYNDNLSDVAVKLSMDKDDAYDRARRFAREIKKKMKTMNNTMFDINGVDIVSENKISSLAHTAKVSLEQPIAEIPEHIKSVGELMASYIPKNDGYISQRIYGSSDTLILSRLYENRIFPLIVGPTGTGKSHLARDLAYKQQVPYMRVNLNGATVPEDLVGQWIPNADPEIQAKYVWQDGTLTMFMRYGGIFVIDEINMAPADILSLFHSITDDERRLVLTNKDGEVINAHPNFYLIATMNVGYEGTKPLNLALKDRFRLFEMDYNKFVEEKLSIEPKLIEIAESIRGSEKIRTPASTRDLLKYQQDKKILGEKVARHFFINNFDVHERSTVQELFSLVMDKNDGN